MIAGPVIAREIRCGTRSRTPWRLRLILAGLATVVLALASFVPGQPLHERGAMITVWLAAAVFMASAVCGCFLTADSLHSESREGTLALLLLTPLKGWHVVLAKLVAHGGQAACAWIALIPVFCIPFFVGGVTRGEIARILAQLFAVMILSMACGLYWSSRFSEDRNPVLSTLGTLALICLAPVSVELAGIFSGLWKPEGPEFFVVISPLAGLFASPEIAYRSASGVGVWVFWGSLLSQFAMAACFCAVAGRRVAKWGDQSSRPTDDPTQRRSLVVGVPISGARGENLPESRTADGAKSNVADRGMASSLSGRDTVEKSIQELTGGAEGLSGEEDTFGRLFRRGFAAKGRVSKLLMVVFVLWLLQGVVFLATRNDEVFLMMGGVVLAVHALVRIQAATQGAFVWHEAVRSGLWDAANTTPHGVSGIVDGYCRSARSHFLPWMGVLLMLETVELLFSLSGWVKVEFGGEAGKYYVSSFAGVVLSTWSDFDTIPWLVLRETRERRPIRACLKILGKLYAGPAVLVVVMMATSLFDREPSIGISVTVVLYSLMTVVYNLALRRACRTWLERNRAPFTA